MLPINYNISPSALEILKTASCIQDREPYDTFLIHHRLYEIEVKHYDYFVIELCDYDELLQMYYDLGMFNDVHIVRIGLDRISSIIKNEYQRFLQKS